jgi:hypothetical protein
MLLYLSRTAAGCRKTVNSLSPDQLLDFRDESLSLSRPSRQERMRARVVVVITDDLSVIIDPGLAVRRDQRSNIC